MIKKRKICSFCAREKITDFCDSCHNATPTNESIEVFFDKIRLRGLFTIKHKCLQNGVRRIVRSGWKSSINPTIKDGVYEDRIIDRDQNQYNQVIKDVSSGEIIHEEHMLLTEHKTKKENEKIIGRQKN